MSELTYKKIVDVEQIDTLGEGTTLFVNDGGSMKQMDVTALGAVKSVNGVLPDENGAIESYHSVSFNFLDGSAVVPGLINYYGTETMAELCDYYASSGIYNVECRRIIMTSGDRAQSRNCIGEEIVKDADGNVTGRRLFFGDDLCPVILDIASNKIIFDPDWVAPTPCVKTVNGIAPDENGDITVEIPEAITDEHINTLIDAKHLGVCNLELIVGQTTMNELEAIDRFGYPVLKVGPYTSIDSSIWWGSNNQAFIQCIGEYGFVEVFMQFDDNRVLESYEERFVNRGLVLKGENGSDYLLYVDNNGSLAVRLAGFRP